MKLVGHWSTNAGPAIVHGVPNTAPSHPADRGQRRATFQRAKSKETKRMLVQAAMALWRTNGYATTTVADICTAAGVSKALFYFYFPRKEDVLFEVGVMSTRSAHDIIHERLDGRYTIEDVVLAAMTTPRVRRANTSQP